MAEASKDTSTTHKILDQLKKCDPQTVIRLQSLLFNDNPEKVKRWHKLFADPIFFPVQNMSLDEQRDIAYKRLKRVADEKLFSIWDFVNDPKNLLTAHEMLAYVDGSLVTKFTV